MIQLKQSLQAWTTDRFNEVLKQELEALDPELLPLQEGLSQSSLVSDSGFTVMVLAASEDKETIHAKAGVFYSGIVAGCSCADDPSPIDEQNEYCVLRVCINKTTAQTQFSLLAEE